MNFESKRVLIIDDHPGMRASIRVTLSNFGITGSEVVSSANDAVRRLQERHFDIILCDYNLGDGPDGQQLLEDLRGNHVISLDTVFLMVTAEAGYEKVISAAELAPDDYLIKPFSAEVLRVRLEQVMRKKEALAAVYRHMEAGQPASAVEACDRLIADASRYLIDVLRLKADLLISLGRFEEAESIYAQVIAMRVVPWARMGLARTLMMKDQRDEAAVVLDEVIRDAPDYLAAYDLLAQVHELSDRSGEAQAILDKAAALSPNTLARQRRLGDLAFANGDLATAEKALATVHAKGRHSAFRSPRDFTALARVYVERGKLDQAAAVTREARVSFNNAPEAAFSAAVAESLIQHKRGDVEASRRALFDAMQLREKHALKPDPNQSLELCEACYVNGEEKVGQELAQDLVKNRFDSTAFLRRARAMFDRLGRGDEGHTLIEGSVQDVVKLNNEGVRRAKAGDYEGAAQLLTQAAHQLPQNVTIVLNAAQAIIVLVEKRGWEAERMTEARCFLGEARQHAPHDPRLVKLTAIHRAIVQKYGARR